MPAPRIPIEPEALAALADLASRQGGLFLRAQVIALGVSDSQVRTMVRAGTWQHVRSGILVSADRAAQADPHVLECAARWLDLPNDVVIAAASAGVLHRLPYVDPPEQPVFAVARPRRGALTAPRPGAIPDHHVDRLLGMPLTTKARTLVDLLRCAPDLYRAQALADGALRAGVPRPDVDCVVGECAGWPGIRQARDAWHNADPRAESPLESEHRVLFRAAGLPVPDLQATIRDVRGRTVARVDFLFREQRTVAESDGKVKYVDSDDQPRTPAEELWREKRREDALRELGFEVVRGYFDDRADGGAALADRLRRAFARAA